MEEQRTDRQLFVLYTVCVCAFLKRNGNPAFLEVNYISLALWEMSTSTYIRNRNENDESLRGPYNLSTYNATRDPHMGKKRAKPLTEK